MENDDVVRGSILSRREILAIMSAGGAALFLGSPVPGLHRDLTGGSVCLRVVVGLRPTHSCS